MAVVAIVSFSMLRSQKFLVVEVVRVLLLPALNLPEQPERKELCI